MSDVDPMDALLDRRHRSLGRIAGLSTFIVLALTAGALAVDLKLIQDNLSPRHLRNAAWVAGVGLAFVATFTFSAFRSKASTADEAVFRFDAAACIAIVTTGTVFASLLSSPWRAGIVLLLTGGHALALLVLRLVVAAAAYRVQRETETDADRIRESRNGHAPENAESLGVAKVMIDAI